jgi:hypothetical protein
MKTPYLVFAGCAIVAAFGVRLLESGALNERMWGKILLVVFGLGSIVLPLLIQRDFQQYNPPRK